MTEEEFLEHLRAAVGLDVAAHMNSRLIGDLGLDSFDIVEVFLAVEEVSPQISIPDQMDPTDLRLGDLHHFAFGGG